MFESSSNYLHRNRSTHHGCKVLQGTFCFSACTHLKCILLIVKLLITRLNHLKDLNLSLCIKEIGELYELDQDIENARSYFERAAELFDFRGDSTTSVIQCKQKVAQFSAQLQQLVFLFLFHSMRFFNGVRGIIID